MSQLPEFTGPAGAAFLLSEPAPLSIKFDHPEGCVVVREGATNVTVNLLNSPKTGDVKAVSWRVIQESLDFLAARREAALSTAIGERQCLTWTQRNVQYDLTCVVTAESRWSIHAQGTVEGARPEPPRQHFVRHDALRFYRMSQCARGLFDAYRNAYLALECVVSEVAPPKQNEKELPWLKRVISDDLATAIPSGIDVNHTLEAIYKDGRNPLFHAKDAFYPPHGEETGDVQKLFDRLTLLLVCLLQHKFGSKVVRRWATMSRSMQDAATLATFDFNKVCFERGPAQISAIPKIKVMDSPRRFGQLWAKVEVIKPEKLLFLRKVWFLNQCKPWMDFELDETVNLSKVANVTFEVTTVFQNQLAPRAFHPE